jgi:hypothetical protein
LRPGFFLADPLRIDLTGLFGGKLIFLGSDAEQRRLCFGGFAHFARFLEFVYDAALGPVLFDLTLTLGFITSFLLARLFLLTFCER